MGAGVGTSAHCRASSRAAGEVKRGSAVPRYVSISRTRSRSWTPAWDRRAGGGGPGEACCRREPERVSGTTAVLLVAAAQAAQVSASRQARPLRSRVRASSTGPAQPR